MMEGRTVSASRTVMTQLVLPNDTNQLGNLMGGNLMKWMDIVCAMCANRHCRSEVVTASVDNLSFRSPIYLGEILILTASVTRAFNTSLEVFVEVEAENPLSGNRRLCNQAFFTFVSIDNNSHKPTRTVPVIPETKEQNERYEGALHRRELRLILAGRMKPSESNDLKALFVG